MITTSENATREKSITRPTRSVHHTSFLCALCHEFVLSMDCSQMTSSA
jgi:hypothetical protein